MQTPSWLTMAILALVGTILLIFGLIRRRDPARQIASRTTIRTALLLYLALVVNLAWQWLAN